MEKSSANTNPSSLPYYSPVGNEILVFEHAFEHKIPLLLKGPTGSGKSRFVEHMAAKLGKTLITVSCHEETSSIDLIGRFIIKGAETEWLDGPLTMACRKGYILYLDEIAEARPDVIVAIHPLTDHRRELFIDKLGERVKADVDFMLVASFNPGYQRGFKDLKPSTRQRFASITFNYPQEKLEAEILQSETGIERNDALKLVSIANKIRNLKEIGLTETVSTRLLVNASKLIKSGVPKRLSVRTAVIEPLTDDIEIADALADLSNLII